MSCSKQLFRSAVCVIAAFAVLLAVSGALAQAPLQSTEFVPGSWTLVLLPDTQVYSEQFPGLFTLQTHWVIKNKDKYNIRYLLHLGDITNQSTVSEWRRAQEAMRELDGILPYAIVPGNHDYRPHPLTERRTLLNEYFPLAKYKDWPSFGGAMQEDMCNTYHLFTAGGIDWIVLALEWAPSKATVQWANNDVLAKYPERRAILVTHAYLYRDATRFNYAEKGEQGCSPHKNPGREDANDGEELWQKLVRKNHFALVFCGHVVAQNTGLLASKNDRGKTVYQMVVDYQKRQLGGEAYLRILEFLPDGKTVHVKSYSPLYDKYLSDPDSQFSFELDR
jgi:hypothetical protein